MLISFLEDDRVRRRYALAEAKRASELLETEPAEKLLYVATRTFGWTAKQISTTADSVLYEFSLDFAHYLKAAVRIHDLRWKLTNRMLNAGLVYLTKRDFARLLEEEIQRKILEKTTGDSKAPSALLPVIDRLRGSLATRGALLGYEELPKAVVAAAMPPCIKNMLGWLQAGKHIPHMGRFAMTSFLINIGVREEEIIKMLHALTDFDEKITRYQVEHIAGKRGSRRKYTSPNCKTLQTHGLCINADELCGTITHPLSYYRRKVRRILGRSPPQRGRFEERPQRV